MTNVFGFSTEPSQGGDFIPIVKYDARSGRLFRVDRVDTGNGFVSEPVDITQIFKAVIDFDHVEVGWIDFPVGSAPSFALVPMGQAMPDRPSAKHKNGVRFTLKLGKNCGGDKPIREMAGTSKTFLGGIEEIYSAYLAGRDKHKGDLPVVSLQNTMPVVSGTGAQKSTNYRPVFKLEGWTKRPDDLVHTAAPATAAITGGWGTAPTTGATTPLPPNNLASQQNLADDFG